MVMQNQWNPRRVLILLTRNWWWPVGMFVLSLLAARLYLRYTTAIYKSTATIQIDFSQTGFLKRQDSETPFPMERLLDAYLELFTTYDLVHAVVKELHLDWEVYSVGKVGRALVFPTPFLIELKQEKDPNAEGEFWRLFPLKIQVKGEGQYQVIKNDTVLCAGTVGEWVYCKKWYIRLVPADERRGLPIGSFLVVKLSDQSATYTWQTKVALLSKRGKSTWLISVNDISASRAQRFLGTLLEHSREYERSLRQVHYQRALAYIDTLLISFRISLGYIQDSLLLKERKYDIAFSAARRGKTVELFSAVDALSETAAQRQALTILQKMLQSLIDSLQIRSDYMPNPLLPPLKLNEAILRQIENINELIERRQQLMRVYTSSSIPVMTVNQALMRALYQCLHTTSEQLLWDAQERLRLYEEWTKRREKLYQDVLSEREVSLLQEDISLRREVYKTLLQKKIQYSIDKEAVTTAIQVTQPPTLPSAPISPNPIQVYALAVAVGLIIGVGGVVGWYLISQQVSYRADLEGLSPFPVIGELPFSSEKKGLFPYSGLQIEVLRSLRNALGFLWEEGQPKVLVVTSTVSGEGKSYVARGIAYAYALAGYRVLLIDADLRRAFISQAVGQLSSGLSLLLAGMEEKLSPDAYIIPMGKEGLFLLPSGPFPPNPTELLESDNLSRIIQGLSSSFDIFVIDTAPLGIVSDTLGIIRGLPHAVILCIFRADYSRISFLAHIEEITKIHHLQKVYLLFNGTKLSKPRYGYGYGYGYYGDGYARRYYTTAQNGRPHFWKRLRELFPI